MDSESGLRAKLEKIEALFAGAGTEGERLAAGAAIERIRACLGATRRKEPEEEMRFAIPDPWARQLFMALCRRYGLRPFRYRRQRRTTIMVKAPEGFINSVLWPEFQELSDTLGSYLGAVTERLIREEIHGDTADAEARGNAAGPA